MSMNARTVIDLMPGCYRLTRFTTTCFIALVILSVAASAGAQDKPAQSTPEARAEAREDTSPEQTAPANTSADAGAAKSPASATQEEEDGAEPVIPPPEKLEASLEQKVSLPEALPVGQPLEITLEITHPDGALVQPPDISGSKRWSLANSRILTAGAEARPSRTTIVLTLLPTVVGTSTIPPMPLLVLGDGGDRVLLRTDPLEVKVITTLAQDAPLEFKEARPPVPIYTVDYTPLWVGVGAGGALLLGLIGFLLVRRRLDARPEPEPEPRDIYDVALEKLQAIERSDMLAQKQLKRYYTEMSEAVREYLGARYGFPGTELTSTEIMIRLHAVTWPKGLSERDVEGWLRRCDRVKFADRRPSDEDSEAALRQAYTLLELTRPKPLEEDAETEDANIDEQAAETGAAAQDAALPRRQRRNAPALEPPPAAALAERGGQVPAFGVLDWETLSSIVDEASQQEEEE